MIGPRPPADNLPLFAAARAGCRSSSRALSDVTCRINEGDRIAVLGSDRTGKGLLLKLIAGEIAPESGTATWPRTQQQRRTRPPVALLSGRPELSDALSVVQNVQLPLRAGLPGPVLSVDKAMWALATVGLADVAEQRVASLRPATAWRVMIARALAGHPWLILADDITGRLGEAAASDVVDALVAAAIAAPAALVVATSDVIVAARMTRQWRLGDGVLITR
ncbi:ATP-binding cassette domain-containing protein [Hamadaea tsunoensis]|uniref:ATP-binding cassette domain-containing protein n=1 Tax=Hamadaea tsunoensis TaxID=53368 RepID=UPI00040DE134|nr:ATP-binding cassette domain-containing protein [Hamadaea tsunoensis]